MLSRALCMVGRRPLLRCVASAQQPVCQLHGSILAPPSPALATAAHASHVQLRQCRHIWGWLNSIFNKVDADRIDAVGADRACAEWLLRCGAAFRWRSQLAWQTDYNSLSRSTGKRLFIEEINADNAAIMHIGFHHLSGLRAVRKVRLHYCGYLDDTALRHLGDYLHHSLESLEISSCGNITRRGLSYLDKLTRLRELKLYDLPEIEDRDACVQELRRLLPKCNISFPPPKPKVKRPDTVHDTDK